MAWTRRWVPLVVCLGMQDACRGASVSPMGRPCDPDTPCGPGAICDPASNTCQAIDGGMAVDLHQLDRAVIDRSVYDLVHDRPVWDLADLHLHDLPEKADFPTQPDVAQPDLPLPDLPPPDLPLSPDTIDPLAPFGTPVPLAALNTSAAEDDPTLTGDMLEIYFDRSGDIYRSTRTSVTAGWGAPLAVTALNSSSTETTSGIAPNGLTIFFASNRSGGSGGHDIWSAARASRTSQWSTPQLVPGVNSSALDSGPCPSADLLTLTFASTASGNWEIIQSTRASTSAAWGAPVPIAPLNSSDAEGHPWLVANVIVFASTRPGLGGDDLYISTRSGGAFGTPAPVASLNTSSNDGDPWLSPDLRTLVFASTRNGGWDLFIATR